MLLARPYPVSALREARLAIEAAVAGDLGPMQQLYRDACAALSALDPEEVEDWREGHERAAADDKAAARAALDVADGWEGVVSVGAIIEDPRRFRGFAWLAALARYGEPGSRARAAEFARLADGADLPGVSAEDSGLFAVLPALVGLGPELADELPAPCPLEGQPVWQILGLPEGDWDGIDPLDGIAVSPETCRGSYAALAPRWREVVGRCLEHGLLVRRE